MNIRFANLMNSSFCFLFLGVFLFIAATDRSRASGQDDALAKFNEKLAEWKSTIIELTVLRQEYFFAETREAGQSLLEKYEKTKAAGTRIVRELKFAAAEAYQANPIQNSEYYKLLVRSLTYDFEDSGDMSVALAVAKALNSQPINDGEIASQVCKCFFMCDQFEEAEKLLAGAAAGDPALDQIAQLITKLKPRWEEEQQKRARDKDAQLPRAIFETTKGRFVVELFEDDAPNTVKNFVNLAQKGFYDKQDFFRVIPFTFAATGSPNADINGNPGFFLKNEGIDPLKRRGNFRGTLCAPSWNEDNTRVLGTIFMITFGPFQPANTSGYCNFGRVIKGMEVVDALARSQNKEGEKNEEFKPDKVLKVTLENLRDTVYEPEVIRN